MIQVITESGIRLKAHIICHISVLVPVGYATFGEIVGAHFQVDPIAGYDSYAVHAEFAGQMGQYHVSILDLYAELCIG